MMWYVTFVQLANGGDPLKTDVLPEKRRILALLNPFGGRGLAPRIWEHAKTLLDLGHLDITLRHTEYAGHAKEICRDQI